MEKCSRHYFSDLKLPYILVKSPEPTKFRDPQKFTVQWECWLSLAVGIFVGPKIDYW